MKEIIGSTSGRGTGQTVPTDHPRARSQAGDHRSIPGDTLCSQGDAGTGDQGARGSAEGPLADSSVVPGQASC